MPGKVKSSTVAEAFHNPKWAEHPSCAFSVGVTRFHCVDNIVWREVQSFFMLLMRKYLATRRHCFSLSKKEIPADTILLFNEQMDYVYKSPRRDSIIASETTFHA